MNQNIVLRRVIKTSQTAARDVLKTLRSNRELERRLAAQKANETSRRPQLEAVADIQKSTGFP